MSRTLEKNYFFQFQNNNALSMVCGNKAPKKNNQRAWLAVRRKSAPGPLSLTLISRNYLFY